MSKKNEMAVPKKIAVLNLSGNVGKTTLTKNLLRAYMPDAKLISVETINNSDALNVEHFEVEELNASQFRNIYRELMAGDAVILDVGASNCEKFMEEMTKFKSSVSELDLVLVPTVPDVKQQKDTITTIEWLHKLGVPADRIRPIFNQYNGEQKINEAFAHVIGYSLTDGQKTATWLPHVVIENNDVFEMANTQKRTVLDIANDTTDWKAARQAAKEAKDMDALELAMDGQMAHDLAQSACANLNKGFDDLLAPYKARK